MILHHRKYSNFAFAIFTEFDIGLGTFKEYEVEGFEPRYTGESSEC